MNQMMLAWTTAPNDIDARRLAEGLTMNKMAACVHVEGPIMAHYHWQGSDEVAPEFKLSIKFFEDKGPQILAWLHQHHPYQVFQWIAIPIPVISPEYLEWAREVTGTR